MTNQRQRAKKKVAKRSNHTSTDETALPTLMDHLKELQGRLFSTVLIFLLIASAAYPFFGMVTEFLMAPLKQGQDLVYLTPGGAFSFIIKVCAYIGLIGVLPVLIFHIYRFFMPAVRQVLLRTVLGYTIASFVLAVAGLLFAYYVSLPAALQFLTGFNLNHINPMLTIDSYFSFIMTYMLAGALLFQLPLIMLIINSAKPLTPSKLMKAQGKIILGSFIVAAIISPTPDAVNQTILASPMVVMYQFGIVMIAIKNRKAKRLAVKASVQDEAPASVLALVPEEVPVPDKPARLVSDIVPRTVTPIHQVVAATPTELVALPKPRTVVGSSRAMDVVSGKVARPLAVPMRDTVPQLAPQPRPEPAMDLPSLTMQSLDGVMRVGKMA